MTASKPMTDPMELVGLVEQRIGQDFDGECHLTEAEARQIAACIREMVEWRPIETAPRDGTVVLTYGSLHNDNAPYGIGETPTVKISQFSPEHGAWCCDAWGSHEPVWWKPLPLPPAPGAEDDAA